MAEPIASQSHEITVLRHARSAWRQQHDSASSATDSRPSEWLSKRVALRDAPPYVALSYAWGDPSMTEPLILDNKRINVTKNLSNALDHLERCLDDEEALWVDALCIDQDNELEKSNQVAHMRDVYAKATKVFAWLGPLDDSPDSDLALLWLENFGSRSDKLGIGAKGIHHLGRLLSQHQDGLTPMFRGATGSAADTAKFVHDIQQSLDASLNPQHGRLVLALHGLLSRQYWSRIWTMQEVVVASKVIFACGPRNVDSICVHHGIRLIQQFKKWQLRTKPMCKPSSEPSATAWQTPKQGLTRLTFNALNLLKANIATGELIYILARTKPN
ncbi:Heterokaryon incompatibility protein 6, OR allele [Pseudocercospora fuligena]|uniref:Heterokaryon incompatibility protein 6, OR allele n=1 Tax=Pseudocercospora fuligena TaxID=685502 RepID=A0A8H6VC02_9PEZI|nr:Heterokaryon incompatibility protein 6, OR allele [Pseudocercospora fuligena]